MPDPDANASVARRVLPVIVAMAAAAVAGPLAIARELPVLPIEDAAKIKALLRQNAGNAEIVAFADNRAHPVRVVRGPSPALHLPSAFGSGEIVTFDGTPKTSVRIFRGIPSVTTAVGGSERRPPPVGTTMQILSFATPGDLPVVVLRGPMPAAPSDRYRLVVATDGCLGLWRVAAACGAELDRVAFAVDGAESSHGADPGMWRADLDGPQGPMQVSAAAAIDAGGGDRFDVTENRQLGRAYLARLFRRYGNWPDAVAAYNWGPGNVNLWIAQGRPPASLPPGVERYRERVLRDGAIETAPARP